MSIHRVSSVTVNTDSGEYEHRWSKPAEMTLDKVIDAIEETHKEWTSMVITIVCEEDEP